MGLITGLKGFYSHCQLVVHAWCVCWLHIHGCNNSSGTVLVCVSKGFTQGSDTQAYVQSLSQLSLQFKCSCVGG